MVHLIAVNIFASLYPFGNRLAGFRLIVLSYPFFLHPLHLQRQKPMRCNFSSNMKRSFIDDSRTDSLKAKSVTEQGSQEPLWSRWLRGDN